MPANVPPLVQRAVDRLVLSFSPEKVVLFGSYAKDTIHLGSDVDLLVVADLSRSPEAYQRRARQLTADCFPLVDVVFASPADVAVAAEARSPFLHSILGGGVVIYERERGVPQTQSAEARTPSQSGSKPISDASPANSTSEARATLPSRSPRRPL